MKEKMRYVSVLMVCVILTVSLLVGTVSIPVLAGTQNDNKQTAYDNSELEGDFADNRVLVILNNHASLDYLETGYIDFPEVNARKIDSITKFSGEQIQELIAIRDNSSFWERMVQQTSDTKEISSYREIICIELQNHSRENVLETIALLEKREDVLYAGPDYVITAPLSTTQNSSRSETLTPENIINLPQAKEMVTNPRTVRVGILDSGVDASHEDLSGKINAELSRNFVDYGFDNPDEALISPLTDPEGHGTHVAGIVAKTAPNVELVSLRVLDSGNMGYISFLFKAIDYATSLDKTSNFIPILNFSGGWEQEFELEDEPLYESIKKYPGLLICGAGNNHKSVKTIDGADNLIGNAIYLYPASYDFGEEDRMIVVGATNQADNGLWVDGDEGSNWGQYAVDLFAPGEAIVSCYPESLCDEWWHNQNVHHSDGYHYMSGTSMATPFVTGVAALVLSVHPDHSAEAVKTAILSSVNPKNYLYGKCVTGGRLNAYKAWYASHVFLGWEYYSESSHRRDCEDCNYYETEDHVFGVWKTEVHGCQYRQCKDCGHRQWQHQKTAQIKQEAETQHRLVYPCCNETVFVNHAWSLWSDYDTTYHRRTCNDCGYEQLQTHRECWNSAKNMCMACRRPGPLPGIITMLPPDEEEMNLLL